MEYHWLLQLHLSQSGLHMLQQTQIDETEIEVVLKVP